MRWLLLGLRSHGGQAKPSKQEGSLLEEACHTETSSGVTVTLEVGLSSQDEPPVALPFRGPAGLPRGRGFSPAPAGFGAHGAAPGSLVAPRPGPQAPSGVASVCCVLQNRVQGGGGCSGPRAPAVPWGEGVADPGGSGRRGGQAGNHARGLWAPEVRLPVFLPDRFRYRLFKSSAKSTCL